MTDATEAAPKAGKGKLPPHTVLHYDLTTADARAWESRDPATRKRNRLALGAALLAGISLLATVSHHLPEWLSKLHSNAIAVAILLVPLAGVLLAQRRDLALRSAERVAERVSVRLEIWDRRLVETRSDGAKPLALGADALRDVIETEEHIFLTARAGTIIVPRSAFADDAARDAFAGHWEEFAG